MPEYKYRAMTKNGLIVQNKVEDTSKQGLLRKLKGNDLLPINITQVGYSGKKGKANKRNIVDIDDIMKTAKEK